MELRSTRPCLVAQNAVVGEHLGDGGAIRQHAKLFVGAGLDLAAVLDDGRTDGHDARLRTIRRAAAQQARCDREDGELPLPASGVGHHWPSP